MKVKNEKGEEIEVFTAEEMEQRTKQVAEESAKKAIEEFKTANPDRSAELDETKRKLQEAEDLLKKAEEEGGNKGQIERLRKERDDAKKAAEDVQKGFDKKLEDFRKEVAGDTKGELLDKLSKGDADLRKKIELEFDRYRPNEITKKDIVERMERAYQLATGNKSAPGFFDGITGGGDRGAGGGSGGGSKKEFNQNEIAIGGALGITEKDRENYQGYLKQKEEQKSQGLIKDN